MYWGAHPALPDFTSNWGGHAALPDFTSKPSRSSTTPDKAELLHRALTGLKQTPSQESCTSAPCPWRRPAVTLALGTGLQPGLWPSSLQQGGGSQPGTVWGLKNKGAWPWTAAGQEQGCGEGVGPTYVADGFSTTQFDGKRKGFQQVLPECLCTLHHTEIFTCNASQVSV